MRYKNDLLFESGGTAFLLPLKKRTGVVYSAKMMVDDKVRILHVADLTCLLLTGTHSHGHCLKLFERSKEERPRSRSPTGALRAIIDS